MKVGQVCTTRLHMCKIQRRERADKGRRNDAVPSFHDRRQRAATTVTAVWTAKEKANSFANLWFRNEFYGYVLQQMSKCSYFIRIIFFSHISRGINEKRVVCRWSWVDGHEIFSVGATFVRRTRLLNRRSQSADEALQQKRRSLPATLWQFFLYVAFSCISLRACYHQCCHKYEKLW